MTKKKVKRICIKVPCECNRHRIWDLERKRTYCPDCHDKEYMIRYVTPEEQRVLKYFVRHPRKRVNAITARCKMKTMWSLMDKKLIKCVRTLDCVWMCEDWHRRYTYFIRTREGRKVCNENILY